MILSRKTTPLLAAAVIGIALSVDQSALASDGITRAEAARLRYQAHEIHVMQRLAWSDGVVTRREQARIAFQQRQLRHMIAVARRN